jgi:hypothetical protein
MIDDGVGEVVRPPKDDRGGRMAEAVVEPPPFGNPEIVVDFVRVGLPKDVGGELVGENKSDKV